MGTGVEDEGAVLVESPEEAWTARAAWEPDGKRIFGDIVLGLKEDVMDGFVLEDVYVQVAFK